MSMLCFGDLKIGDKFEYQDSIYVKTEAIIDTRYNEIKSNAKNISSSTLSCFEDGDVVKRSK